MRGKKARLSKCANVVELRKARRRRRDILENRSKRVSWVGLFFAGPVCEFWLWNFSACRERRNWQMRRRQRSSLTAMCAIICFKRIRLSGYNKKKMYLQRDREKEHHRTKGRAALRAICFTQLVRYLVLREMAKSHVT